MENVTDKIHRRQKRAQLRGDKAKDLIGPEQMAEEKTIEEVEDPEEKTENDRNP